AAAFAVPVSVRPAAATAAVSRKSRRLMPEEERFSEAFMRGRCSGFGAENTGTRSSRPARDRKSAASAHAAKSGWVHPGIIAQEFVMPPKLPAAGGRQQPRVGPKLLDRGKAFAVGREKEMTRIIVQQRPATAPIHRGDDMSPHRDRVRGESAAARVQIRSET